MLYQGLIQSVRLGAEALRQERWDRAQAELSKARRIVTYLANSLRDEGAEISERLGQLYGYCLERIVKANLERRPELLDGVLEVTRELNGAWSELAQGESVAAGTPAPGEGERE